MGFLLIGLLLGVLGTIGASFVVEFFALRTRVEDLENAVFELEDDGPDGGNRVTDALEKVVKFKERKPDKVA